MSIAKEAWRYCLVALISAAILNGVVGFWVACPLWVLAALLFYLGRDPSRSIPSAPLGVVSPADGQIMSVEKLPSDPRTRVLIKMGLNDTYILRSPAEGKLTKRWAQSEMPDNGIQCDHLAFGVSIVTDEQDEVVLFIRGYKLFPMKCYMTLGERIGQGQRCGFSPFGACLEVMISTPIRMHVKMGDRVTGGESILGTLLH